MKVAATPDQIARARRIKLANMDDVKANIKNFIERLLKQEYEVKKRRSHPPYHIIEKYQHQAFDGRNSLPQMQIAKSMHNCRTCRKCS